MSAHRHELTATILDDPVAQASAAVVDAEAAVRALRAAAAPGDALSTAEYALQGARRRHAGAVDAAGGAS